MKLRCAVPFCSHTTTRFPRATEWICGEHWRMTSKDWRRRRNLFRRRRRYDLADKMWDRLKAQAIERAAGIT